MFPLFQCIRAWRVFLFVSFVLFLEACNNTDQSAPEQNENVIQVVTRNMDFEMKDTIPSGWNTFRYSNESVETHFMLLDKYPDGITIDSTRKQVIPVFQEGMDLIDAGKFEAAQAAFGFLPGWFPKVVYTGGCGLIAPGHTCDVTLHLDPGYYIMECYVKMPNGTFHGTMGMLKAFVVSDSASGLTPPEPDVRLTISGTDGITWSDSIKKGPNVFSVFYKDQKVHENFVGHDVNLVKLDQGTSLDTLENWMNWADPRGMISPTPAGVTFLGGVNDMPGGSTGYFKADLQPGNYAFISEVPDTRKKGLLKTFTVSD